MNDSQKSRQEEAQILIEKVRTLREATRRVHFERRETERLMNELRKPQPESY